jgi:hypothetical protein
MSILDWPLIAQTRRNHGLEHAAVHVLSARYPGLSIMGRSTPNGIYIYGELTAEQIQSAVAEALARLRAGESHLVIHPGCGTNLVTSGTLAGAAAFTVINVGQRRRRTRWDTLPLAILAATFALIIAQPLGPFFQERITTSADMSTMEILGVWRTNTGGLPVHRIDTHS